MYVDTLLSVHRKFSQLLESAFASESSLSTALDKVGSAPGSPSSSQACKAFINDNGVTRANKATAGSKSPELLARHSDALLRHSSAAGQEEDVENHLNDVMVIFKVRMMSCRLL